MASTVSLSSKLNLADDMVGGWGSDRHSFWSLGKEKTMNDRITDSPGYEYDGNIYPTLKDAAEQRALEQLFILRDDCLSKDDDKDGLRAFVDNPERVLEIFRDLVAETMRCR